MKIRITNNNNKYTIYKNAIKKLAESVLAEEDGNKDLELDITVVTDDQIAQINEQYLNHKCPTDVISFPQRDYGANKSYPASSGFEDNLLGDIVVSADRAADQSRSYSTSLNQEFGLYIIHGILHLLGHNDQTQPQKNIMEKKQDMWFNILIGKDNLILIKEKNRH